jgi:uncharacterized lipoprotein YmbA
MKHVDREAFTASATPWPAGRAVARCGWAAALAAATLLAGCASAPDRYYTLAQPVAVDAVNAVARGGASV